MDIFKSALSYSLERVNTRRSKPVSLGFFTSDLASRTYPRSVSNGYGGS